MNDGGLTDPRLSTADRRARREQQPRRGALGRLVVLVLAGGCLQTGLFFVVGMLLSPLIPLLGLERDPGAMEVFTWICMAVSSLLGGFFTVRWIQNHEPRLSKGKRFGYGLASLSLHIGVLGVQAARAGALGALVSAAPGIGLGLGMAGLGGLLTLRFPGPIDRRLKGDKQARAAVARFQAGEGGQSGASR